jgi:hypothetical protein
MCKKLIYLTSFVLLLGLAGNAMAQLDPATVTTGHAYLLDNVTDQVPDDSANDNTGIIVGDPNVVDGLAGKALQFDGVDDGVDIPDSQFINVTNGPWANKTVMAVFNCADVNKPEKQTVYEQGGLTRGLTIYVFDGQVYVGGWNKAEYQWNPGSWISTPINSNEWHAVALVIRDGADAQEDDKFEMWMDGSLIGKAPGGQIYNHGNDNAIGYTNQNNVFHDGDGSGDGWYFEGIVDEVWILNDALTGVGLNALTGPVGEPLFLDPPDGTQIEATSEMLQWRPGELATSHNVYMGTNLDEVAAGTVPAVNTTQSLVTAGIPDGPIPEGLVPDTIYYWRVESVNDVNPESPWSSEEILSLRVLPRRAFDPSPADGSTIPDLTVNLTWTGGWSPIMHQTYFGTDPDEVANAAGAPLVMDIGFDPGPLETFMTYYWRVDEFYGIETVKGPVWSFSTPEYLVISDEETTLDYDNTAEPFVTEFAFDTPQDLTYGGVSDLTLKFLGAPSSGVSLDEATGTYSITGNGHDIWDNSDDFHFGYRELTGDAVMVARVVDNGTGSNAWAKGGVMIRQSIEGGSVHAMQIITGGNGGGSNFQWRPAADGGSSNGPDGPGVAPPYWVKLERVGNDFTGSISPDGVTWTQQGDTVTIEMTDPVLIGLCVTSHQTGELRTFTFDNVDIEGNISANDISSDVGDDPGGNDAEPLYVALEDSTGAVASVTHPHAAAVQIDEWRDWRIPLSKFAGVDLTNAAKLYIGVGDLEPGGTGSIRVDTIRVVMPTDTNIIWVSDFYDDDGDGVTDDIGWVELLEAQGHTVDYTMGDAVGNGYWRTLDDDKIAALNAADLIIVSRCSNSGDYADGDEPTQWNSVKTPIMLQAMHIIRNSRWLWVDSESTTNLDSPMIDVLAPNNPIFAGVESPVKVLDEAVGQTSFVEVADVGNGTLLAQTDGGLPWLAVWEPGVEFYAGSGQIATGPRMMFIAGTSDVAGVTGRGVYNLTPEGETIFLNAVNKMLSPVPVGYWKLDDGEGTIAVDSSGNGNDGILNGTAMSWMPDDGMFGGALNFDGTASATDYVEISTADMSLAAGTIAMWGKLPPDPQLPATRYFCGHTTLPAWSSRIQLYMDNSDTILDLGLGDSHARHTDIMSLTTETWYHVALTWDGGNYAVYVNGEEKANGSYTGLDALNPVADIGNDGNEAGRDEAFNGLLDDVRIYDRALSEAEVSELSTIEAPANILANGGFEDGVAEPWSTYGDATLEVVQELAGAAVPEAPIEGGSCLHVVVGSAGANFWDAGLQHAGHVFEEGKSYTLSAYLKAKEGTMDINFKPELGADPWTGYGSQEFTMTDTWAEYTVNTGVIPANVDPATITFHIAYAPGEFWVDDVRFTED